MDINDIGKPNEADDIFEYEKLCIHDLIGFADVAMKISETKMLDHPDPVEEERIGTGAESSKAHKIHTGTDRCALPDT